MVRKIRAKLVLRLRAEGFSGRQIAAQGMSRHSVAAVLEAADREGVGFVDVAELDEAAVYARLFPGRGEHESVHAQPDWTVVHRELARVGVTLKLLHGEYVDRCHAEGATAMGYDRFCKTYQHHVLVAGAASRVGHKAGQSVEVDWSGPTMQLTDPVSGQGRRVFLFVGASLGPMPADASDTIPVLDGDAAAAVAHRGGHVQIIAAAGSGKTEVVSQRVASLLQDGEPPESIVAFTLGVSDDLCKG